MCGISGLVVRNPSKADNWLESIRFMQARIRHRGPDDEGLVAIEANGNATPLFDLDTILPSQHQEWSYSPKHSCEDFGGQPQVVFGHRRLSILDLSARGHQPLSDQNENWITYNGELYNYIELRKELANLGHEFQTETDTEVLLAAYREWGTHCLDRFNGMWSFVIYDAKKKCLFGARDRTGVKPLYYQLDETSFRFCSEMKALANPQKNSANLSTLYSILVYNQFSWQDQTPFAGIKELPPAHQFVYQLQNNDLEIRRYFKADLNTEKWSMPTRKDWDEQVDRLEELLERAVAQHLRSDVPVGSCLSGGLDSSTLVALSAKQPGFPAFSALFPGSPVNEEKYIREFSERYELQWHPVFPDSSGLIQDLEDLVYAQDLPLLSSSTFAQYRVMKKAQEQNVKVLLNGQGADELLGGYDRYFETASWNFAQRLDFKNAKAFSKSGFNLATLKSRLKPGITNLKLDGVRSALLEKTLPEPELLSTEFAPFAQPSGDPAYSTVNEHLYADYYQGFLSTLLRAEDRNSMRFSIESRVPFADDLELARWAFALPSGFKLRPGENKPLLRSLLQKKKCLPISFLQRKDKLGFATPHNQWLKEEKTALLEYLDYIPDSWVNKQNLRRYWSQAVDNPGPEMENYRLFKWITLGIWCNRFGIS
ncbi:asparagine synthase (glutamine-hydrolyzing) [bacterium SCSIO 12741]|nr:asparagine synthase (glutamine-hydrolyzing) [bacterium SCSIO 12741]